ncbi:MAG: hypothetical protein KatS3mg110_1006 [Pirellulaceae bacterium]|nr:MAG: hypothetical protein KatS3mg110_1006 [Pirellulaceae bacterium]
MAYGVQEVFSAVKRLYFRETRVGRKRSDRESTAGPPGVFSAGSTGAEPDRRGRRITARQALGALAAGQRRRAGGARSNYSGVVGTKRPGSKKVRARGKTQLADFLVILCGLRFVEEVMHERSMIEDYRVIAAKLYTLPIDRTRIDAQITQLL